MGRPLTVCRSFGRLAQLVRARASHARGHWFESSSVHQSSLRRSYDSASPSRAGKWHRLRTREDCRGVAQRSRAILGPRSLRRYYSVELVNASGWFALLPRYRCMLDFYYVYILEAESGGRFYVGLTRALSNRLAKHNAGGVPHSAKWRPWRIKTVTAFRDRERAAAFEQYL
jgi:putative endonuclease